MRLFAAALFAFAATGIGGFSGTLWWWLAAALSVWFEWTRKETEVCSRRLTHAAILMGLVTPFLFQGGMRFALGMGMVLLWFAVRFDRLRRFIPAPALFLGATMMLCAYALLYFFSVVMWGNVWVGVGWVAAMATYAYLIPCAAGKTGVSLSRFGYWIMVLCLGQVSLLLYFLPVSPGIAAVWFVCVMGWLVWELKQAQRAWHGKPFMLRFAFLVTLGLFLFFIARLLAQ